MPQLKLLELVASCGELWRVVAGCGELWQVVKPQESTGGGNQLEIAGPVTPICHDAVKIYV